MNEGATGRRSAAARPDAAPRIPAEAMVAFIADVFVVEGLPAADAARVAQLMTEADLTGADAHGIFRLPQYVRRLRAGGINKRPDIRVSKTAAATALVDGDNGMGHLVVGRATDTAIALARDSGIGWVGVRRSNHAGTAGLYAAMPAEHGMIGLYAAVANANHMAVWGGTELLLGTNPLGIAVPSGEGPLVLDMATTVVSYGTVKKYALQGLEMPEGWFVNAKTGEPLTDPKRSAEGLLLPIGGYKGSGLAIMLGLLAGVLNGAAFGRDVVDFNADDKSETNTGQFVAAIDVARFMPLASFTAEVDRHVRDLHRSKRLPGVEEIRLPGERRRQCRDERSRDGVPLPPALVAQLDALADEIGVARLAERTA
ncbi:MAG TPA: Ldh family oxidoreductase [Xanthobacteraceae bacterium]|nr:Ldh family oxidoreductase [Xanthobacteraceae bacterium]